MKIQLTLIILFVAGGLAAAWSIVHGTSAHDHAHHDDHGHGHGHKAAAVATPDEAGKTVPEEGPQGGKLLRGDGFDIEVTIFEDEVPPEFRLYAYREGTPISPSEVEATVELLRLDKQDRFTFEPEGDFLRGTGVVNEPHSFDVVVRAQYAGKASEWTYESYEGRAIIAPEFARAAGMEIARAGPATIKETVVLQGVIRPNADRVARVGARFPGVVKSVSAGLGETVAAGDVLAVVESNESLQVYAILAPHAGTVLERAASVGSVTGEAPLFVIGDLSTVWLELRVFPGDVGRVTEGLSATVKTPDGVGSAEVVLTAMLPTIVEAGQTRVIRVPLDNRTGQWTPGLRVVAEVKLAPHEVPLAVRTAGLQSFRDFTVVFAQVGDTYEVRMLELGRSDGQMIEVIGGLDVGERYVAANSFLAKADAMKSGASHDH